MFRVLYFCLLLVPLAAHAERFSEEKLIGEWEWLGNSWEKVENYSDLMRTGPNIERFRDNGEYHYIYISRNGDKENPVVGSWQYQENVLTITRPDNGTFNNTVVSFDGEILILKSNFSDAYHYMRKK